MTMILAMWYAASDYAKSTLERAREDIGQDFVEYALIIGVISLVIVFLFMSTGLKTAVSTLVTQIGNCIDGTTTTSCNFGTN